MAEADAVSIADSLFVGNINYYAAAALIFYDYFLLLDREAMFIWRRAFSCLSLLLFAVRYPTLIAVVGDLFVLNRWQGQPNLRCVQPCAILLRSEIALSFVVTTACAVFSAFRAFALCDCILVALLICGIVNPAITLCALGVAQRPSLMTYPSVTCTLDVTISAEVFENPRHLIRRVLLADVAVLVLTWIRVEASRINFNASVTATLLRNGTWYFFAVLLVNLVGLGFSRSLFLARPLTSWIATLTALLTERFMLDLLEASQGPCRADTQLPRTAAGWSFLAFCGNSDLFLLGSMQDEHCQGHRTHTEMIES
ncbi:hypothetical protein LXA43DRAFT_1091925 [Ganoderma leucocontextum]|nr:hypothetical protein LXA43DRAFT_1091925 [Ganoderma leucocontextum]